MRVKIGSLQTRIIVFFGSLMLAVQLGGLALVETVGVSNARATIDDQLAVGGRVFNELIAQRSAQLAQGARVLAADYAFREALASHDDETIASALGNHGARIHAQLMLFIGLDRSIVGASGDAPQAGAPFEAPALIDAAAKGGMASSIAMLSGRLYQVVVVPVSAPLPVGWVVMGFEVDDRAASDLKRITDLDVTFFSHAAGRPWTLQASTLRASLRQAVEAAMRDPRGGDRERNDGSMQVDGTTYVTHTAPQGTIGDADVSALLQVSLEHALEPFRRLMSQLVGVALVGILISMVVGVALARGIAQPVRELAGFARRIAAGDYSDPPRIARVDEIGDLSHAFDRMRDGIASRERRITELAYRDSLTALPNRTLFADRLQQAIVAARRMESSLAVLIMGLDRFKDVNDSLGHRLGDVLLVQVAERLRAVLPRESDTVARLGGDEFAMLLPTSDVDGARVVARRILAALEKPLSLDGHMVDVHASIGIAGFPEHGDGLEDLMRRADVAMHTAKRDNVGFAAYDVRHDRHTAERLSLMSELRRAIEENQLVVFYQPKVDLRDPGRLCVEALVRWVHPQRGLVPPAEFIPFAEQTGYIRVVTLWMLDAVSAQCARWNREGLAISVSINISARDLLNPEMPVRFASMLAEHRCPAPAIWLEITESAILEDAAHALENLERLAALGCKLSIDDYGTGYSSLSYLKKLPVDELKIDRSFVMNMMNSRDDRVIVQSTIDLAHNMGLKVTAEGVEDEATLERLRHMGCDMAQGYLMSKPISANDLGRWMRESRWVTAREEARASVA